LHGAQSVEAPIIPLFPLFPLTINKLSSDFDREGLRLHTVQSVEAPIMPPLPLSNKPAKTVQLKHLACLGVPLRGEK
jgi:hypothetical protein